MTATKQQHSIRIRVLFYREANKWIAQGIDFDIVASGDTRRSAERAWQLALVTTLAARLERGLNPFKIARAPVDLELRFSQATQEGESKLPSVPNFQHLPPAHIIKAVSEARAV